jgi:hypothetical protein
VDVKSHRRRVLARRRGHERHSDVVDVVGYVMVHRDTCAFVISPLI